MKGCLFCEIINGTKRSWDVYEDKFVKAFLDINPASEGHILVIPKKHYSTIFDINDKELQKLIIVVKKISLLCKKTFGVKAVNIISSNGKEAQQEIPHLHFHILPRREGDKLNFNYDPIKMDTKKLDDILFKLKQTG